MKLNMGAGNKRLAGYTGVDAVERSAADIVAPAWSVPLEDGSVEEIMAIHLWEHFYRWQCDQVIKEWHRLLEPRGRLVLEMPDLWKACRNIVEGHQGKHPDQLTMWALYGDPRDGDEFMAHRWGWTAATITKFLDENGFDSINEVVPQFHHAGRAMRDMRIEARKA